VHVAEGLGIAAAVQVRPQEIIQSRPLWVPKTSSAGWIDAKRAVERQPY
jgi:hypothetical protein